MHDETLTVLLIEDSADYATLVQRWLQAPADRPAGFILNWSDTLESGLRRLAAGGVDVILLDLGLPDSDGHATFASICDHCGSTPTIVLSAADDEPLSLRMIQEGAADYLVKTSCNAELLRRALLYAVARRQLPSEPDTELNRTKVVWVAGSKGGTGATTLACVLAADLRYLTDSRVLLADLDVKGGSVSFVAGVTPRYSLNDAIVNLDNMDREIWNGIVAQRAGGLDILTPPPPSWKGEYSVSEIGRLFQKIQRYYDWIVVDVGCTDALAQSVAVWSTDILLVSTLGLASLHQCKQTVKLLEDQQVPVERMQLVINRHENNRALSETEVQKMFGVQVAATLPESAAELYQALLQRRLPSPSSGFRMETTRLARKLAGLPEEKAMKQRYPLSSIANRFLRRESGSGATSF